jgi:hypothetical protein
MEIKYVKMLNHVFGKVKYLYICVMELLVCPICQAQNLIKLPSTIKVSEKRIVCENEYVRHIKIGAVEFLAKTALAIQEEREEKRLMLT